MSTHISLTQPYDDAYDDVTKNMLMLYFLFCKKGICTKAIESVID